MFRSGFGFNRGLHDGRSFFVLLHSTAAPGVQRWNEYLAALESCLSVSPTAIHIFAVTDGGGPDIQEMKIPPGMVLAMGDHRGNSTDGRFFGLISEKELFGRAIAIYYRSNDGFVWRPL